MNESRYIGIFNQSRNGMPITKMVAFGVVEEDVVKEVVEHSLSFKHPYSEYHISEYQGNWDANDKTSPLKTKQVELVSYPL